MNITVNRKNFIEALNRLNPMFSGIVEKYNVYRTVSLYGKDGKVFVRSMTGSTNATLMLDGVSTDDSGVFIRLASLRSTLNSLGGDEIQICHLFANDTITLSSGQNEIRLKLADSGLIPFLEAGKDETASEIIRMPTNLLREMIKTVAVSVSKDFRRQLNGVYIESNANELSVVATDGRRLTCIAMPPLGGEPSDLLIPIDVCTLFVNAARNDRICNYTSIERKGSVIRILDETNGAFEVEYAELDEHYPSWRSLFSSTNTSAEFDAKSLLTILKRAESCVGGDSAFLGVTLEFVDGVCVIKSRTQDNHINFVCKTKCRCDKNFSVAINCGYLIDALRVASTRRVVLNFDVPDDNTPVVHPILIENANKTVRTLIMPLRK